MTRSTLLPMLVPVPGFLPPFFMVLLLLPALALGSAPAQKPDKTLSPYFVVKGADSDVDGLPLKGTRADVRINGVIARVKVTQMYANEGEKPLEAIYVFPGSTRAAVFSMTMTIGDRTIRAKIERRDQARKIYEAAKAAGKSASLLEQQRPNVFTMNVANIMPGDAIRVEMEYTELLEQKDGEYEFVYPAVVGPRYTEKTGGSHEKFTQTPYRRKGEKVPYSWDLGLKLDAGVPVHGIRSPSHRVDSSVRGTAATVQLADGARGGDSDFVLRYSLRGEAVSAGVLLFGGDDDGGEKFFLTMVQPPRAVDDVAVPKREYVFIVDVSGSMRGFPLDTAKALMRDLFAGLRSDDTFNVMMFSGGSRTLAERSVPATSANLHRALDVLSGMRGGGGTRILPALKRALAMEASGDRARTFVVITDGYVSVEPEVFELIRSRLDDANMFAFGIGTSVNRHLIEGMAHVGMGEPFYALNAAEGRKTAVKFGQYIASPALTGIKVEYTNGFDAYDVEPRAVPDLFAERPVVVFGKYRGKARGRILVSGITGRGRWSKTIDVGSATEDSSNDALRYLWARHRIRRLADMNKLRHNDERKQEVTQLGLKYSLMTAYTSFIAVDDRVRNDDGGSTTVKQPLPLPQGVEETAVGAPMRMGRSSGGGGIATGRRMHKRRVMRPRPRSSNQRGYRGPTPSKPSTDAPTAPDPKPAEAPEPASDDDNRDGTRKDGEKRETSRRVAGLRVSGALSQAAVSKLIPQLEAWLGRCTSKRGVSVVVKIGANGRIQSVRLGGSATRGSCWKGAGRMVRFPSASGTTTVTFTL